MGIAGWVREAQASAVVIEHEWDRRALDWPLWPDSVVVEVGGYKGRWALQIAERYTPLLYVFEPQPWAFQTLCEVLGEQAEVLPYALGVEDAHLPMGEWETDGCSFVSEREPSGMGRMREIAGAFHELEIDQVDLMLVNIEGYEYTLIPHMLDRGIHPDRLMVQFHTFADPQETGYSAIATRLDNLNYQAAWDYGVTLKAWVKSS